MKRFVFLIIILISIPAYSQLGVGAGLGKWRVGGGMGLNFGNNNYFALSINPNIGYMITSMFEGGITLGYQYSSWKDSKSNLFSGGPYLNFYPIQKLFLRGHYEYFTGNSKIKGVSDSFNYDESALWLGGGYRTGGKVSFYTGIMYNVLWKEDKSMFSNGLQPIIGVSVGF